METEHPTEDMALVPARLDKLDWVQRNFPQLQRWIGEYSSEDAQRKYLEALRQDGLLDTHVDVMAGVRLFQVEVVAIMLGDFTAKQLLRFQTSGSIGDSESLRLKNLVHSFFQLNKIATEMEDAAVFSRRSRAEHGLGRADAFSDMLQGIANGDPVPEAERMSEFLKGGVVKIRETDDAQFEIVEDPSAQPLTDDEMAELAS